MAWFLALQGPPSKIGQSATYELHESADVPRLTELMAANVANDGVVAIPTILPTTSRRQIIFHVRPAAWGAWAFYEMTDQERREMAAANPVVNALAQQAAKQRGQQQPARGQQPTGPSVLPRFE